MTVTYKYVEIPKDTDTAINILKDGLMPLFNKYWSRYGGNVYDKQASFNIQSFIQMWQFGGIAIIGAYDGDKMVGYLLAIRYTPMSYNANAMQVEQWYAEDDITETGMFDYLIEISKFMDINELWTVSDIKGTPYIPWTKKNTFTTERYVKE